MGPVHYFHYHYYYDYCYCCCYYGSNNTIAIVKIIHIDNINYATAGELQIASGNSDGLSIDVRDLSNKTIDKLLEKKIDLIIWTLNSMERLRELSKKNIRAIITDEVKDFADFLKRKS